jgi:tetratricopeptide (TPR) repeat protein
MLPITTDVPSGDSFHRAKAAAAQSVSLDNTLAEAHVALCAVDFWYEWDWPRAEEECRKAIALNPNYALAHMRYAHVLSNEGRHAEAFQEIERARLLDPSSHITNTNKGFFLYQARQYDLGVEQLRKALEFDPSFWVAHVDLCKAYEQVRMYDSGLSECRKAWELSSGNTEAISLKAHILAAQGKVPEARKELQYLKRLAGTKYVPPYNVALIYAGLGEKDPSLEWLEKAYQEHDVHLVFLLVDAKWDALRGEPRFQNLLHRMGLGQ